MKYIYGIKQSNKTMENQKLKSADQAFAIVEHILEAEGIFNQSHKEFEYSEIEGSYEFVIRAEFNPETCLIDCDAAEWDSDDRGPTHDSELKDCTPEQAAEYIISRFKSARSRENSRYKSG